MRCCGSGGWWRGRPLFFIAEAPKKTRPKNPKIKSMPTLLHPARRDESRRQKSRRHKPYPAALCSQQATPLFMASMDDLGDLGSKDASTTMRLEISSLRQQLADAKELVRTLKVDNMRLKCLNSELTFELQSLGSSVGSLSLDDDGGGGVSSSSSAVAPPAPPSQDYSSFFSVSGPVPLLATTLAASSISVSANPLSLSFSSLSPSCLFVGFADCTVRLLRWGTSLSPSFPSPCPSPSCVPAPRLPSPPVSLASGPSGWLAIGCMDGGIYALQHLPSSPSSVSCLQSGAARHSKFVATMSFNVDRPSREGASDVRLLLATGSHDGALILHSCECLPCGSGSSSSLEPRLTHVHTLNVLKPIEALTFVSRSVLAVYVRGESFLRFYDLSLLAAAVPPQSSEPSSSSSSSSSPSALPVALPPYTSMTLNGSDRGRFDDHVSFAVLSLVSNPEDTLLLASTDHARNIALLLPRDYGLACVEYEAGLSTSFHKGVQVTNLYGHTNDEYSTPRAVWSLRPGVGAGGGNAAVTTCNDVVGNSQADHGLVLWGGATGARRSTLGKDDGDEHAGKRGSGQHCGTVRDLVKDKYSNTIASCSFDKTIKVWTSDI